MKPRGAELRTVVAKEHPRQREVVDVLRPAGDLGAAFAAGDGLAQQHGQ